MSWDSLKEEHSRRLLGHVRRHAPNLTDETILAHLVQVPAEPSAATRT